MYKRTFVFCFLFFLLSVLYSQIKQDYSNSIFTIPFPVPQNGIKNIPNTVDPCGPYIITIPITSDSARIISAKLFWSRNNPTVTDSVLMTNTGGNNWTGAIPGNGQVATYRYCIIAKDSLNRTVAIPPGAPSNTYIFIATADETPPLITHTPIVNTPLFNWPPVVSSIVTDNCGIDSVWVRWKINNGIARYFKLIHTSGNNFSALFNSLNVAIGDVIHYKIFAQDASPMHNKDSTAQYNFTIINVNYYCIGTDTVHIGIPFNTYWYGNRTQILYTHAEIIASGGNFGWITNIGFNVYSASSQPMNGYTIRMQNTNITSLSGFLNNGFTTCYNGIYTVPGTGLQFITLQTPFVYNGTSNLLIEICYGNTSYTTASVILGTPATNMAYSESHDISTACTTFTNPTVQATRPNICLQMIIEDINNRSNNIPSKYNLSQNYPNPFNPVTRINFDIPKQGLVSLKVYDILGREVKELVNEIKSPGSYSVDFNAMDFSSGTYFYRLESNGFSDVKRMILIK